MIQTPFEVFHYNCVNGKWESEQKRVKLWGAFCGKLKSDVNFVPSSTKIGSSVYYRDPGFLAYPIFAQDLSAV